MKQQFAAKHPWTILAAGAAIQVLTGLPAAWGVFQQPVMEEYGLSEQGAGYAFALLIAAFGVGCVLGGFLQDKKGPRCAALWGTALLCGGFFAAAFLPGWAGWGFFLAFSIPAGLGTAFLYPSIQSCAQKWYAGRKGLATGVIGGAVGLSGAFLTRGAQRPAAEKTAAKRQKHPRPFSGADAAHKAVLVVCGRGMLFHSGGAAVQSHHLKAGHGTRAGRDCCAVEHRTGQRGQRCGTDADAHAQRPHRPPRHRPWAVCGFAWAVGGVLGGAGLVGGGVLRWAHLLLLGAGCGAARPFHRPVRPAPRGGELRLSGAGAERGQSCVPLCSQLAGAGERAAPACHGRCGGGFCSHLGAASGAERPALKRAKRKGCKKFAGAYGRIDKNLTTDLCKAVEMPVSSA